MPDRKQFPTNIIKSELFKYVILFILICLPLMLTLSDYGITSDEPIYMEAAWNIRKWLSLKPQEMFEQETIDQ
ncbi:MAG: hypothetical protein SV375_00565 [Thermodesulfobacteriota bacterium]|nr:hypothetical protein [Thermodesulfobacteriota bacterium]